MEKARQVCKQKGPGCVLSYTRLEPAQGNTGEHQRRGDICVCPGALQGDVGKPIPWNQVTCICHDQKDAEVWSRGLGADNGRAE